MATTPLPIPLRLGLLLGLGAGALSTTQAQVRVAPAQPQTAQVVVTQAPAQAPGRHSARIEGLRDNGPAALDRPLAGGWALAGFSLRFANGDHKLRRIGVLGEERFVRFALADSNGDDPFNARAQLTALPGVRVQQVSAEGGGKFEIPLPGKAPPNSTLVLSGFEFQRADGSDANIRNIGIWLVPERGVAQVSLTDDQGLDFRGLEASLGIAAAATGIPLPGMLEAGSISTAAAVAGKVVPKAGNSRYRPYRVRLQYAWVPNAMVTARGALSGTQAARADAPRSRIDALQGFEFTFGNSDHHLLELAVNPVGTGGGTFRDNNLDDPMQWSATYVSLRPAR